MRSLTQTTETQTPQLTKWRLALLIGAALLAPATLVIQALLSQPIDVPVIAGGSVVLFVLVLLRMNDLVRQLGISTVQLEQLVERERLLRRASAAIATAGDRQSLCKAAVNGVLGLVEDPTARASLSLGSYESMTVVASAGDQAGELDGVQFDPRMMASPGPDALAQQRALYQEHVDTTTLDTRLSRVVKTRSACIAPLFVQDQLRGLLSIASDRPMSPALRYALESLGMDTALALEGLTLGEHLRQRQNEAWLAALVQNASDIITIIDATAMVKYVSPSVTRVLGYEPSTIVNATPWALIHPDDCALAQSFLTMLNTPHSPLPPLEVRVRHADGRWVHVEIIGNNLLHDQQVGGLVLTTRDISERKAFQQQLTHQAFHDALTDLPNRALFGDRLQHALASAQRRQTTVAVLFLDLDRFKTVNDSLGHDVGDRLLVAVTQRLATCLRPTDTISRFGGDEFTILLEDMDAVDEVTAVAERILDVLQAPFVINGHEMVISASIGIVLSTPADMQPTDLLRYADVAMYQAKHGGKARYVVFDRSQDAVVMERLSLEHDLRHAIERGELHLVYQPIVDLQTGGIVGFEVLTRWNHPQRGNVSPAVFIPVAEETGLILPIGRWVLEGACRQVRQWQTQHTQTNALEISVNLSARQFRQIDLVDDVARTLRETGLDPACLKLEITESVVMEAAESTIVKLRDLKALGVRLAIDDFGTGYSSLAYLKRFSVDTLKIDRAFISRLGLDAEDTAIVRAVTTLAQTLGLTVTAEGVETEDIVAQLRALGCEFAQGYFFARPLPSEQIEQMLKGVVRPVEVGG